MKAQGCSPWIIALALPLASSPMSCSRKAVAVGTLEDPSGQTQQAVTFKWRTDPVAPRTGEIQTVLPDGSEFRGRWYQVVQKLPADTYAALWEGWEPYWSDWVVGVDGPVLVSSSADGFYEFYTGRVLANLVSLDGKQRMRCRFNLQDGELGLRSGGQGDCQLTTGAMVRDARLRAS